MALLDDVKVALRVTSPAFDSEVMGLIQAAKRDMLRAGVPSAALEGRPAEFTDSDGARRTATLYDPLVVMAITLYAKARFGYDNEEAARFQQSYRQTVIDMVSSPSLYGGGQGEVDPDEVE